MNNLDTTKAIEIADNIFWIGLDEKNSGLRCNPYIIIDESDVVLIEPGSVTHFPYVLKKVESLVDLSKINKILVSHQDPDLCAGIPLFKDKINNPDLEIITHSRASVLIDHYGAELPYYLVDQNNWNLTLKSGRKLDFIFTPYLHFPGSFVTLDSISKILFSGDLFGAFTFNWSLYADQDYVEAMKAFHENYMPSKEILNHSMKKLEKQQIEMIAPQHGSIISKDQITEMISALKELDCGDYIFEEH